VAKSNKYLIMQSGPEKLHKV